MPKESVYFKTYNIKDRYDERQVKEGLDTLPGVISVSVNREKSTLAVDYDNTGTHSGRIHNTLKLMGYDASISKQESHNL